MSKNVLSVGSSIAKISRTTSESVGATVSNVSSRLKGADVGVNLRLVCRQWTEVEGKRQCRQCLSIVKSLFNNNCKYCLLKRLMCLCGSLGYYNMYTRH